MERLKHFFKSLFFYHEPRDTYEFSLPEKNDEEASKKVNPNNSLFDPDEQENNQNGFNLGGDHQNKVPENEAQDLASALREKYGN